MNITQKIIDKIRRKGRNKFVSLTCKNAKGNALVSYLESSILMDDDDPIFDFHTNQWESREIARILNRLNYNVDVINFENTNFVPKKKYDVFLDIYQNLHRLKMDEKCIKILHLTTSYPEYSNAREKERIEQLYNRKKKHLKLRRKVNARHCKLSLKQADFMTLVGCEHTLKTYPKEYQDKINKTFVTPSKISFKKTETEYLPVEREFLWFGGGGAVHKGLDLLLEIFSKNPQWKLNIVGPVLSENDFVKLYKKELFETPNIKLHNFIKPASEEFKNICSKSFCFIFPSCSEGTSTAAVTALSIGLYPIISIDAGLELPDNTGLYLKTCSKDEIENSINSLLNLKNEDIIKQIKTTQEYILQTYNKKHFTESMTKIFIEHGL